MVDRTAETDVLQIAEAAPAWRDRWRARQWSTLDRPVRPAAYRVKLGREIIQLDAVAFRILQFLASRPYHAYTRRRIAQAVSSCHHPVREETLDGHIRSLRRQLGFFRDYVQSVPYIGYRFRG